MSGLLSELHKRNKLFFWFGFYNILMAIFCMGVALYDHTNILGTNIWLKPIKFFISVSLTVWTFGWMMHLLHSKTAVLIASWLMVISLFFENAIILLQSYRKVPSHFNETTRFDAFMYQLMLFFIILFTCAAVFVTIMFFYQKKIAVSQHYCWGIRMGMLLFVVFTFIGGWMVHIGAHSIPASENNSTGIVFFNWSLHHGDLRIAHFFGVHTLQMIPLISYYALEKKKQVIIFSIAYFIWVLALFVLGLMGQPLLTF